MGFLLKYILLISTRNKFLCVGIMLIDLLDDAKISSYFVNL